jgi:hypothetical protein
MYPRIPCELVANLLGSMERTLGTTDLEVIQQQQQKIQQKLKKTQIRIKKHM